MPCGTLGAARKGASKEQRVRTPDEEVWRGLLTEAATYVESLTR